MTMAGGERADGGGRKRADERAVDKHARVHAKLSCEHARVHAKLAREPPATDGASGRAGIGNDTPTFAQNRAATLLVDLVLVVHGVLNDVLLHAKSWPGRGSTADCGTPEPGETSPGAADRGES